MIPSLRAVTCSTPKMKFQYYYSCSEDGMLRQRSKPDPSLTENSKKDPTDYSEKWVSLWVIDSRRRRRQKMVKCCRQTSGGHAPLFSAYRRAGSTPPHRNYSMIHVHKMIMELILHFFSILIIYCCPLLPSSVTVNRYLLRPLCQK